MERIRRKVTCALVLFLGIVALSVIHGTRGDAACSHPKTINSGVVSPTCTSKGYTKVVCCTCGTQVGKTNWTNALGHSYKAATCAKPQQCSRCGNTTGQPSKTHTSIVAATCTSPKKCTTCGATFGEAKGHTGVEGASCVNKLKCTTCKTTIGSHSWNPATCESAKTCAICNKKSGSKLGHSWASATCTAPKTCKRTGCYATSGEPKGHKFSKATCKKLATCSRCKITTGDYAHVAKTAATCTTQAVCKNCKKSYGDLAEHNYTFSGTVPPTYSQPGYHYLACSICGAQKITEEIPALGYYPVTFQHEGIITTTNVPIVGGTFTIPADIDTYEKDGTRLYWLDELSPFNIEYYVGQTITVQRPMSLVPIHEEIYRQIGTAKNPTNGVSCNVWLIDEYTFNNDDEGYYGEFLKKHPEKNNIAILLVEGKTSYRIKNSWQYTDESFKTNVCQIIEDYNNKISNTENWNRILSSCVDEWTQHNLLYAMSLDRSVEVKLKELAQNAGCLDWFVNFVYSFGDKMNGRAADVDIDANSDHYIPPTFAIAISIFLQNLIPDVPGTPLF